LGKKEAVGFRLRFAHTVLRWGAQRPVDSRDTLTWWAVVVYTYAAYKLLP
jgi:hypothetical protein